MPWLAPTATSSSPDMSYIVRRVAPSTKSISSLDRQRTYRLESIAGLYRSGIVPRCVLEAGSYRRADEATAGSRARLAVPDKVARLNQSFDSIVGFNADIPHVGERVGVDGSAADGVPL